MKALNIISTAYRGTLEEQDDTIVWITHAMKGAGANLDVLLLGSAVNYAVRGQEVEPLSFGSKTQAQAPRIADDVMGLIRKGIQVYVMTDDIEARGIPNSEIMDGLTPIGQSELPTLLDQYDCVWQW